MDLPLMNYGEAVRLREEGISMASIPEMDWISRAKAAARWLAAKNSETCIEEVYGIVGLPDHPNAAGSVFKGKDWVCIGTRGALRVSRRTGLIRRWSLK